MYRCTNHVFSYCSLPKNIYSKEEVRYYQDLGGVKTPITGCVYHCDQKWLDCPYRITSLYKPLPQLNTAQAHAPDQKGR